MTLSFSALMLALFGVSLILITLSLRYLRSAPADSYNSFAKFFLVALRLAIGWHCFVEGMEKIHTPNWSSEAYLREASGPLAEYYRDAAGDRLRERLDVGESDTLPSRLDLEWRTLTHAFTTFYQLTGDQAEKALAILEKQEKDTLATLTSKKALVTKISAFPPDLKLEMTMKQRLTELERLEQRVRDMETKFPSADKDVHTAWKNAKADLNKWRGELKGAFQAETEKLRKGLTDLLSAEQKSQGKMPEPVALPRESWAFLEWSDFLVQWSLVVLGSLLMLGLLSRLSSFAMAFLILSFYLAMPPLPGWPESPRLEGHYLLINKTLIEVLALFALTFIPTGRWAGIDGLLCACCGKSNTQAPG